MADGQADEVADTLFVCSWLAAACYLPRRLGPDDNPGSSLAMQVDGQRLGLLDARPQRLRRNVYQLASPGNVTVGVNASGTASGGINPHMNIVLADTKAGFDVTSGSTRTNIRSICRPAHTFLRTEFNNDLDVSTRALTVQDLTVTGATVTEHQHDCQRPGGGRHYIQNFRKGNVKVGLSGLGAGHNGRRQPEAHAFNFGTAVPGFSGTDVNNYLGTAARRSKPIISATQSELQCHRSREHGQMGLQRVDRATP